MHDDFQDLKWLQNNNDKLFISTFVQFIHCIYIIAFYTQQNQPLVKQSAP